MLLARWMASRNGGPFDLSRRSSFEPPFSAGAFFVQWTVAGGIAMFVTITATLEPRQMTPWPKLPLVRPARTLRPRGRRRLARLPARMRNRVALDFRHCDAHLRERWRGGLRPGRRAESVQPTIIIGTKKFT